MKIRMYFDIVLLFNQRRVRNEMCILRKRNERH